MVRLLDRPDKTSAVYRGLKAINKAIKKYMGTCTQLYSHILIQRIAHLSDFAR